MHPRSPSRIRLATGLTEAAESTADSEVFFITANGEHFCRVLWQAANEWRTQQGPRRCGPAHVPMICAYALRCFRRRPARYGALKAYQLRATSSSSHFVCIVSVGATMDQATFQDPSPSRLNPATKLTVWVVGWPDRLLSW
jgi:hypothetical protein